MIVHLSRSNQTVVIKLLIDGIGKRLRFEAKTSVLFVDVPVFALQTLIGWYEITSVKLYSWLVRMAFKSSATFFVFDSAHQP